MKGASVKAIQELAGHADFKTTMRYMHLAPRSLHEAAALLDDRPSVWLELTENGHHLVTAEAG